MYLKLEVIMAAEDPNERRGRNNFEAILRFCVQNTKSEDAPENSSAFRELSPEVSLTIAFLIFLM